MNKEEKIVMRDTLFDDFFGSEHTDILCCYAQLLTHCSYFVIFTKNLLQNLLLTYQGLKFMYYVLEENVLGLS